MERQRVNVDIDKELWRKVSIRCVELGITKRTYLELALEELLKKEQ
jgi:Arc/MetJ family transcription regulator